MKLLNPFFNSDSYKPEKKFFGLKMAKANVKVLASLLIGSLIIICFFHWFGDWSNPRTPKFLQPTIESLAKLIANFITENTKVKLVLLLVNIPVYILIGTLLFGGWKRFWRAEKYSHLSAFYFLGSRKGRETACRDQREGYFSWRHTGLHVLHLCLWILLYFVQYAMIKNLFLN